MQCGFKASYDCVKSLAGSDTSEDLHNADIPILVNECRLSTVHQSDNPK